jgi:hypothetical protein
MVDYLIEIVFKNITAKTTECLLKHLSLNGQKVVSFSFTSNDTGINWDIDGLIEKTFEDLNKFGLFINLSELKVDGIYLLNCGIAVYKYGDTIDLELNFQLSELKDCNSDGLVDNLMKFAKSIATHYHIRDYFCGLEPAQDIKTRLFTNEQLGPFFL